MSIASSMATSIVGAASADSAPATITAAAASFTSLLKVDPTYAAGYNCDEWFMRSQTAADLSVATRRGRSGAVLSPLAADRVLLLLQHACRWLLARVPGHESRDMQWVILQLLPCQLSRCAVANCTNAVQTFLQSWPQFVRRAGKFPEDPMEITMQQQQATEPDHAAAITGAAASAATSAPATPPRSHCQRAGLCWSRLPVPSVPARKLQLTAGARVYLADFLEYVATEVVQVVSEKAGHGEPIGLEHMCAAIEGDGELLALVQRLGLSWALTTTGVSEQRRSDPPFVWSSDVPIGTPAQLADPFQPGFPFMRDIKVLLNHYAWFHRSSEVIDAVRARFIAGELASGDPAYTAWDIRPFAYYGRAWRPVFCPPDKHCYAPSNDGSDDELSACERAFDCIAFDLIDGAEREYPLLIEYRGDANPDAPAYCGHGALFDRRTLRRLGSMRSSDQDVSSLSFVPIDAVPFFRHWTPHAPTHIARHVDQDGWSDAFGEIRPSETGLAAWCDAWRQDASNTAPAGAATSPIAAASDSASSFSPLTPARIIADPRAIHHELQRLVCRAARLLEWRLDDDVKNVTRFAGFEPPALVRQFTVARLESAMDGAELALPRDLISIVADYAPVQLPFIPLNPRDRLKSQPDATDASTSSAASLASPAFVDQSAFVNDRGVPFRFSEQDDSMWS